MYERKSRLVTKLVWEPEVVCEEVGHVVVQPFQHVQGIVDEEDCVVIAIKHPFEVVVTMKMGSQKWGHPSPVKLQNKKICNGNDTDSKNRIFLNKIPHIRGDELTQTVIKIYTFLNSILVSNTPS